MKAYNDSQLVVGTSKVTLRLRKEIWSNISKRLKG